MVGDGHTNVAPTRDPKIGFRTYPVKLHPLQGRACIIRSAESASTPTSSARASSGSETPPCEEAWRRGAGARSAATTRWTSSTSRRCLLAMPEVLHALGLAGGHGARALHRRERRTQRIVTLDARGSCEMMPPDTDTSWMSRCRAGSTRATPRSDRAALAARPDGTSTGSNTCRTRGPFTSQYNQVGNKEDETIEAFAERLFAFVDDQSGRPPRARPSLEPRRERGAQSPAPARNHPLPQGRPEGRTSSLSSAAAPGPRPRGWSTSSRNTRTPSSSASRPAAR